MADKLSKAIIYKELERKTLVQMSMTNDLTANLDKSLKYCEMAKNCDLVFFPEIQLTPFFP